MTELKQSVKVKVKAKLTERDKDTKEILGEYETPENIINDPELVEEFLEKERGEN